MNITPSTVYWVAQCDCIRDTCIPIIFIGGLFAIMIGGLTVSLACEGVLSRITRWMLGLITSVLVLIVLAAILGRTFIPTTRTMAAMYIIPAVANNEKVQDCGNRLYDLAIEWMDELKPAKKEEN